MAGGVSKEEQEEMRKWLLMNRITFEFVHRDSDNAVEIKLIDYKNKCLIASKTYSLSKVFVPVSSVPLPIRKIKLTEMVLKFEEEELFSMLFGWEAAELPEHRLIRED